MTNNYYKVNGEFFFFDSRKSFEERGAWTAARAVSSRGISVWKRVAKRDVPVIGIAPAAPNLNPSAFDWAEEPS